MNPDRPIESTQSGARDGIIRFSDGRLDPFENASHLIVPGSRQALCSEPIADDWEVVAPDAILSVNCRLCHTQAYWLPASGRLDRKALLDRVIEPWPADVRRHVTGDGDPRRGRYARPENLQVCLSCFNLRGPFRGYDNLCDCDRREWIGDPVPIYGDLSNNAHLCKSCLSAVVSSGSRWSPYYCDDCRPAVVRLGRTAGHCIVPFGPHSIMNGTYWRSTDGKAMTSAQAVAFSDQLNTLFANQDSLFELTERRTESRAQLLGFRGHAVLASDFVSASHQAGFTAQAGFIDFVVSLDDRMDASNAELLWQEAHASDATK